MTWAGTTWRGNLDALWALNAPIATQRLRLEPLTAAHADAMFEKAVSR